MSHQIIKKIKYKQTHKTKLNSSNFIKRKLYIEIKAKKHPKHLLLHLKQMESSCYHLLSSSFNDVQLNFVKGNSKV